MIPILDRWDSKTLANSYEHSAVPVSAELAEDSALRKAAWRLIPLMTVCFVLNYIDRTNIGFAALTMNRDLRLSTEMFGWGAGILFFGYCFFEVPSNILLYRFGARIWLARIMITWGLLSAATALVVGPKSFYVVRFLLGVAEAGFNPGVMFFFMAWFPRRFRSRAMAWFQMAIPLSAVVAGPLCASIMQIDGLLGIAGWQWIFIIEGLPATILGIVLLIVLVDRPGDARWLSPQESQALTDAVSREPRAHASKDLRSVLRDPRIFVLSALQFGFTMGSYGITIFLPQILREHHLSILSIGLLSAVPYLCGCVATILWAGAVDRKGHRIANLAATCTLGAAGLLVSIWVPSLSVAMIGLTIAIVGVTSARGIFWSIPPQLLAGQGAASGLALISSIGAFGGFLGPVLMGWLKTATGSFSAGLVCMAALIALSGALTALLPALLRTKS
ncbi:MULTISPECIES: MFS transporter [Paraburkholderia]|uniref:MFS transporter n=1 Tax=Paraburkholderia TaxID=1822464 RepID=UPI00225208A6|nr:MULTISPECIES: MFS transporter [Paraburkholderia]MCX4163175.1 MFS transporter [Paraburkholderia megapolitana]MDN7158671.1 MFS transporter [Paraburkholderia sp. CHISQ3]MDQ6495718.1 MFS transporter [Paraburkholderia megapolitana]